LVRRKSGAIIGIIILLVLIIVILAYPYLINAISGLSNSTPKPQLFSVELTPSSQTTVIELSQQASFNVKITGTISEPFAINLHIGINSPLTGSEIIDTTNSQSIFTAPIIQGNSKTYQIGTAMYVVYGVAGTTYHAYVTVIDSQGNSYSSNSVNVIVK
jgi:hypothetical protein